MKCNVTLKYENRDIVVSIYENQICKKSCSVTSDASVEKILSFLEDISPDAVVCPGGCLKPLNSGCYLISKEMAEDAESNKYGKHKNNRLVVLCKKIADAKDTKAYMIDAISTDELSQMNRVASNNRVRKQSRGQFAEMRAVLERAKGDSRPEEQNYIVAYLDDFVSVGAFEKGKCLDVNDMVGAEGPMGFRSSGDVPCAQIGKYFCENKVSYEEMQEQLLENSGVLQYLKTDSPTQMDVMAETDENALLIAETMAYQIAKWIGSSTMVLSGDVKGILISGKGIKSTCLMKALLSRIEAIAPVQIIETENLSDYLAAKAIIAGSALYPVQIY